MKTQVNGFETVQEFGGMKMTLDGVEHRFHVRERDNRVAIVLSQPGWAAMSGNDYWYVSVEDLVSTGRVDEGQDVKRWVYREGSSGMVRDRSYASVMKVAREWYAREANAK